MTDTGKLICINELSTRKKHLQFISVCKNEVYVADCRNGVHRSKDDGKSWNVFFGIPDEWKCQQVIKVSYGDQRNTFWTIESDAKVNGRLQKYTFDQTESSQINRLKVEQLQFKAINTIYENDNGEEKDIGPQDVKIAYDGERNIYVADYNKNSIHVFSINGEYICKLLSERDGVCKPLRLVVDRIRRLLYVAQTSGELKIFTLL